MHPRRVSRLLRHARANTVAYLALLVAMGGTSYAAVTLPKDSVRAKQIKAGAVRTAEVKNGSLLAADFKAGQLPAGPKGDQGDQGIQGVPGQPGADALSVVVPTVRVTLTAAAVVGDNSGVTLAWDNEVYDASNMHDPATPTNLVAPVAGVYRVTATVNWNNNGLGVRYLDIRKNGVVNSSVANAIGPPSSATLPTVQNIAGEVRLNAGEFVTVRATIYNVGTSVAVSGNTDPVTIATMSFVSP